MISFEEIAYRINFWKHEKISKHLKEIFSFYFHYPRATIDTTFELWNNLLNKK